MRINPARPKEIYSNGLAQFLGLGQYWVEPKYNGWRLLIEQTDSGIRAYTRHGKIQIPEFLKLMPELPTGLTIDGEWMRETDEYIAFDCIRSQFDPIETRRNALKSILPRLGRVRIIEQLPDVPSSFKEAKERGHEGIVLKLKGSAYPMGDTYNWLKCKE